jgi:glycosyltransferase involved in cell wall biosynthesis
MIDVVIPCRNEESTIGPIVRTFKRVSRVGRVIVVVDLDTTDNTHNVAKRAGGFAITGDRGKGQNVSIGLGFVNTKNVFFCDGDYTGLRGFHVREMLRRWETLDVQLIGIPDIPTNYPPDKWWSWPWVSGFRRVQTAIARSVNLHGYLMEVQLNQAHREAEIPGMFVPLQGLVSPYNMTDQRRMERDRDFAYGKENGIL